MASKHQGPWCLEFRDFGERAWAAEDEGGRMYIAPQFGEAKRFEDADAARRWARENHLGELGFEVRNSHEEDPA